MSKPPVKYKKLHSEQWNGSISKNYESRRLVQMSTDIKNFITRSMSNEQDPLAKHNLTYEKPDGPSDMFETIATTFNFKHQEGTDPKAELKVIKIILVREGLLMSLKYLSDKSKKNNSVDKSSTSILELLAQIRESTLNYLEALCLWRQTAEETEAARVFIWERRNYTMKIISDLDFLGENALIVSTLGIPQSQFKSNPLMLTNNLEDMNTWMDPFERASYDCSGAKEGPQFESRLRLRFAERILLQEIELVNSMNESAFDDSQQIFITQQTSNTNNGNNSTGEIMFINPPTHHQAPPPFYYNNNSNDDQLMKGSTALEGEYDDDDDGRLINQDNYLYQAQNEYNPNGNRANWVGEEMVRCKSADSNTSMKNPSNPDSRASGISYGFSSAPSSSHGGSRNASSSAIGSSRFPNSQPGTSSFEYGHDFFSGNWSDSRAISSGIAGGGSSMEGENPSDIYFLDDGNTQQYVDYEDITNQGRGPGIANRADIEYFPYGNDPRLQEEDLGSHQSMKSVDTVHPEDIRYILNLRAPPKVVVVAASACIILLSSGTKVPTDLTWNAFVRLGRQIDLTEAMFSLDPTKLSRFKLVALMPFIELIEKDGKDFANMRDTSLLYPEFVACSRLILWVQQFTASGLKKINKMPQAPIPKKTKPAKKVVLHPLPDKTAAASGTAGGAALDKSSKSSSSLGGTQKTSPKKGGADSSTSPIRRTVSDGDESVSSQRSRNKKLVPALAELVPCHKEIVDGKYKNSLLLVVLAAAGSSSSLSSAESIVFKVYDINESKEAVTNVVLREYSLYLKELNEQYNGQASQFFNPEDLNWWTRNASSLINVQCKSSGNLKLTVSKKSILNLVLNGLGVEPPASSRETYEEPVSAAAPAGKPSKLVIPKPSAKAGHGAASSSKTPVSSHSGAAGAAKGRSVTPGRSASPQTGSKKAGTPHTSKRTDGGKPSEKTNAAPAATSKPSEKPLSASKPTASAAAAPSTVSPAPVAAAPTLSEKAPSVKQLDKQPSTTQIVKASSTSKIERPVSVGKNAPSVEPIAAVVVPDVADDVEQLYDETEPTYEDNEFDGPETMSAAPPVESSSVKVSTPVAAASPSVPVVSPKAALLPSASAAIIEIQADLEEAGSIGDYEADFEGQPSVAVEPSYAADFEAQPSEAEGYAADFDENNDEVIASVGMSLQQESDLKFNVNGPTSYEIDDLDALPASIQRELSGRGRTPANSAMILDGKTNDQAIRHALSEIMAASIILEAEKEIQDHPEMLHHDEKQLSVIQQAQQEFDDGGNDEEIDEIE